jgi:hypothetical protein
VDAAADEEDSYCNHMTLEKIVWFILEIVNCGDRHQAGTLGLACLATK